MHGVIIFRETEKQKRNGRPESSHIRKRFQQIIKVSNSKESPDILIYHSGL